MHKHKQKHKIVQSGRKERVLPQGDLRGGLLGLITPRPMTLIAQTYDLRGLGLAWRGWKEMEKRREGKGGSDGMQPKGRK